MLCITRRLNLNGAYNQEDIDVLIQASIQDAETLSLLIKKRKKLSKEVFAKLLLSVCEPVFWNKDYLNIFSMAYGKPFIGYTTIQTSMLANTPKSCGYNLGVDLCIAYTEDCTLDDHYYSVAEIQTLLNDKKIVIMHQEVVDAIYVSCRMEPYFDFGHISLASFTDEAGAFYKVLLQYISSTVKTQQLQSILYEQLRTLKQTIQEIYNDKKAINLPCPSNPKEEYIAQIKKLYQK